jgi:chromosome segregation ATPase|tara:strand:+ start:1116 stop:1811 length:696 start_codon:yes stop_codon:yes gene_type:complete
MGLLNRIRDNVRVKTENNQDEDSHSNIKNDISNKVTEKDQMRSSDSVQNELSVIKKEISVKTDYLVSISEKLELSKKEYEGVISKLMSIKKEFNENKNYLDEIKESEKKLLQIKEKITITNSELDKIIAKKNEIEPSLSESIKEKQKIDSELEQRNKELEIVKKQLSVIKTKKRKESGSDSKQIVESASHVVASVNKRLQDTLQELDMVRKILEKEKAEHNKLKEKFENQR